ncbi:unnamed protein product [Echinostoma caproni]|uniref:Uncharacterized protein n=1 Tax=Echinostoma caproni TaxID=27848 RepID=A0A183AC87_9TREM|nr:unnamed protein product [Echinostoma caproni]
MCDYHHNFLCRSDFFTNPAIKQHNVVLRDNPMLCHLAFTIRWEEVFVDKNNQAAIPDRYHDRISQRGCDPSTHKLISLFTQESVSVSQVCYFRLPSSYVAMLQIRIVNQS